MGFCSWRAAIALRFCKRPQRERAGSPPRRPWRGPLPPKPLPTGLAIFRTTPNRRAWSGPSNKKNESPAPVDSFHEFRWCLGCASAACRPFDSLPPASRPCPPPGPWFRSTSRVPTWRAWQNETSAKSCLTKQLAVARRHWRSGWPGAAAAAVQPAVFAAVCTRQARPRPAAIAPFTIRPPDRRPTISSAARNSSTPPASHRSSRRFTKHHRLN